MTNQERQQKLDVEKWLKSQELGVDNSGVMPWCTYCDFQTYNGIFGLCTHNGDTKVKYPCAKAYNRMTKNKNGKKE